MSVVVEVGYGKILLPDWMPFKAISCNLMCPLTLNVLGLPNFEGLLLAKK